jgi:hypothetical protein
VIGDCSRLAAHCSGADGGGPKEGSHAAAGNEIFNAVMIELVAGMECGHIKKEHYASAFVTESWPVLSQEIAWWSSG